MILLGSITIARQLLGIADAQHWQDRYAAEVMDRSECEAKLKSQPRRRLR